MFLVLLVPQSLPLWQKSRVVFLAVALAEAEKERQFS